MIALAALTGAALGGCVDADAPAREPSSVASQFAAAIEGCAPTLNADGGIDRDAIAAAGWRPVRHIVGRAGVRGSVELGARPVLRPGEYEAISLTRPGAEGVLELASDGPSVDPEMSGDQCRTDAVVTAGEGAAAVRARVTRALGSAPNSVEMLPMGGDFLLPRFDRRFYAHSWRLPRRHVQLDVQEPHRLLGLEFGARAMSLSVTVTPALEPDRSVRGERRVS